MLVFFLNLHNSFFLQQNWSNCRNLLLDAYKRFPDNYDVLTYLAKHEAAEIATTLNEGLESNINNFTLDEVINLLKKAHSINSNDIEIRAQLGYLTMMNYGNKKDREELKWAKNLLVKTLKMGGSEMEKTLIVSSLNLIAIILQDDALKKMLKQKY